MATNGIQSIDKRGCLVRLQHNLAAANGAPGDGAPGDVLKASPSSTQFFDLRVLETAWIAQYGIEFIWPDTATLWLYETAGSGTMSLSYARLWLYLSAAGKVFPAGTGADATKGYLNGGATLGETGANLLRHCEPLLYPGLCDGINVELGTYGDASQRHNVDVFLPAPALSWRLAQQSTLDVMERVLERIERLPVPQTI